MKIHRILLLCFLTALCQLVSAKLNIYTGAKGGSGTVNCRLSLPGNVRFFCKDECKEEGILIKTDAVKATSGRYSITYREALESQRGTLSVTIKDLTESDSGRYRCGLGSSMVPNSTSDFEIRVSDEHLGKKTGFMPTSVEGDTFKTACVNKGNISRFFFCKDECKKEEDILIETDQRSLQRGRYSIEYIEGSAFGLYVTIAQVTKSDMGQYKCGYGRALSTDSSFTTFPVIVIDAPTTSKPAKTKTSPESTTVFSDPTDQPAAAALTTSKPNQTLVSTSSATAASLSSTSGSYSPASVFPETTSRPAAAALTTSKPNQTLQPFSALAPSTSSATTTQSLSSRSGSYSPASVFPETTSRLAAAALTTSKPNQTLQPFSALAPSTSSATTTQSLSSRSESSTAASDPDTISRFTAFSYVPRPDNVLPLAVSLPLAGALLTGVILLVLHVWKTKRNKGETVI